MNSSTNSVFWVFFVAIVGAVNCQQDVAKLFSDHEVVPNVIAVPPEQELKVKHIDSKKKNILPLISIM